MTAAAERTPLISRRRAPRAAKRVLLIEPNDDGTVGGSYQVLFDLARHLEGSAYHPVALFNRDNSFVDRLREAGIEVHVLDAAWQRERRAMRSGHRLRQAVMLVEAISRRFRFLLAHAIDLVHVNGTPQTTQDDWLPAARLAGVPVLANCAGNLQFEVESMIERSLMRSFDRVLPVSEHVASQLRRFGYAAERVTMIHPGIDVDAFRGRVSEHANSVREELSVSADTMLVALVGNVRRWKGQHVALDALALLSERERERIHLLVVGATAATDGGYARELDAIVKAHGISDRVSFLGSRTDVPDLMAASDVVLHTSIEPEPFGLVLVEGMALGKVLVASDVGGPAEILDESSGLRFPAGDANGLARLLGQLLADRPLREKLGAAAYRRAESFSIASTVAATVAVYDELLDER